MRVAAAIIAGGRATRMGGAGAGASAGAPKGLLIVDGRPIIERQLEVLRPLFEEIILVANDPAPWVGWQGSGVRVVPDRVGGGIGPLAGVDAALAALAAPGRDGSGGAVAGADGNGAGDGDAVVCVAGDMPFLDEGILRLVRDHAPAAMAVVPRINGRPEPLLARYARAAAPAVRAQIARGAFAMMDLLSLLSVTWIDERALRTVDPALRSFINVNTPEDLARLGGQGRRG